MVNHLTLRYNAKRSILHTTDFDTLLETFLSQAFVVMVFFLEGVSCAITGYCGEMISLYEAKDKHTPQGATLFPDSLL